MLVGDDTMPIDPADPRSPVESRLISDDVNDDLAAHRSDHRIRFGNLRGAVLAITQALEHGAGQQREHRIRITLTNRATIVLAHRIGQYTNGFRRNPHILRSHHPGELGGPVVEGVRPHATVVERFFAAFPDEVGIMTDNEAVDLVPQPGARPGAFLRPQGGGDLGIEGRGDRRLVRYERSARQDHLQLPASGDPVAEGVEDLGQRFPQTDRLIDQVSAWRRVRESCRATRITQSVSPLTTIPPQPDSPN